MNFRLSLVGRNFLILLFVSFTLSHGVQNYSRSEAMKVVEALEKIQREQGSGTGSSLQKILITESELNSYIAYRIETEKEEVMKELRLKLFKGNKIEGMTVVDLRGQKIPKFLRPQMTFLFSAKLETKDGKVKVNVKDLFLEGQRIQPIVIDVILMIAARIDHTEPTSIKDWYELPYGIKNIEIQRGKALLFY